MTTSSDAHTPHEPEPRRLPEQVRRVAAAGFAGTFIEYYDFALYGVLTVFFAPQFFPAADPATSLLAGLAVFGAGFLARPVGGVIFGRIGDRYGRRRALVMTLTMMGIASGLVGLLPDHAAIGVWAPVALVLLRLLQGVSAGSELLGSMTFVLESAPPSRRIFLASLTPFGAGLGSAVAVGAVWVLGLTGGATWLAGSGWRVLFLISFPLTLIALYIRTRVEDSPEFAAVVARDEVPRSPLSEVLRDHRRTVALTAGIAFAVTGGAGITAWFSTYLAGTRGLPGSTVFAALSIGYLVGAALVPVFGVLTARYGQRTMVVAVLIGMAVLSVPVLATLGTGTSLLALAVAFSAYQILAVGMMPPAFSLIAQLFPTRIRYTGATTSQNIGNVLGGGLAPFAAASLALGVGSALGAAIWVVGAAAVGLACLAALVRRRGPNGEQLTEDLVGRAAQGSLAR